MGERGTHWLSCVVVPLGLLSVLLWLCVFNARGLLEYAIQVAGIGVPLLPFFLVLSTLVGLASFFGHFSRHIPGPVAWLSILGCALITVLVFACLNMAANIYCTAPNCPGTTTYVISDDLPVLPPADADLERMSTVQLDSSFRTSFYFSIVTFTTLGFGDMQPSPNFRLYVAFEAILGYLYLGMIVGAAIDLGARATRRRTEAETDGDSAEHSVEFSDAVAALQLAHNAAQAKARDDLGEVQKALAERDKKVSELQDSLKEAQDNPAPKGPPES